MLRFENMNYCAANSYRAEYDGDTLYDREHPLVPDTRDGWFTADEIEVWAV